MRIVYILVIISFIILILILKKKKMKFPAPLKRIFITSKYGERIHPITGEKQFHNGIDLRASLGTPIYASFDGIVTKVFYNNIGGNQVLIKKSNQNIVFGYAHLDEVFVAENKQIRKGEIIGTVGNTGRSTAPHLHFTTFVNGKNINPENIILI